MTNEEWHIFETSLYALNDLYGRLLASNQLAENRRSMFKLVNKQQTLPANEKEEFKPVKLKYGQGSITKRIRKNKGGQVFYWQGRYMDGGRQKTLTAATQKECIDKLKAAVKSVAQEKNLQQKLTFGEWLDKWYNTYKKPFLKPNSIKSIRCCMKLHISDKLKETPLIKLTPLQLQECLNSLELPRQRDITYQIICGSLRQAKFNELIDREIWLGITYKKHVSVPHSIITEEQEAALMGAASPVMRQIIMAYLWTGCRRSELLALEWSDIDFKNKMVHIQGTKTKNSKRTVPLFEPFKNVLLSMAQTKKRIFSYSADWINREVQILREKCGFDKSITPHSFRHTFASRLNALGVDLKTIQIWLGHASIQTTADIYVHCISKHEIEVARRINESLKNTN